MTEKINDYEKNCLLPRRQFLKKACGAAVLAPFILNLETIAALAQTNNDYKALVCVFLYGGNDATGTVIPRSGQLYTNYADARQALAIPQNQILATPHNNSGSPEIGLHPNLSELKGLYDAGKMAVLGNVGPLIVPTTKQQFENNNVPLPPNVFSHEDQQLFWQTTVPGRPQQLKGWGGRIADLLDSLNTNSQVSMSISLNGSNYFQLAGQVSQFNCSPYNVGGLNAYNPNDAFYTRANRIWNQTQSNPIQQTWNQKMRRAVDQSEFVKNLIATTTPPTTAFPDNYLGAQLKRIAHLIAGRNSLNQKRQIFFCGIGGFDTHENQANNHPNLLRQVSQSIAALYNATTEMGVADKVTIFTAADFGRTLNVNGGAGTDHGWGAHHFIVGGGVRGGNLYGTYPDVAFGSANDTGDGRWLPTTSVDQYGATLAKWFGVAQSDLGTVSPNLGNFNTTDLGFMN